MWGGFQQPAQMKVCSFTMSLRERWAHLHIQTHDSNFDLKSWFMFIQEWRFNILLRFAARKIHYLLGEKGRLTAPWRPLLCRIGCQRSVSNVSNVTDYLRVWLTIMLLHYHCVAIVDPALRIWQPTSQQNVINIDYFQGTSLMLPHPNVISEAIPPHQEKYLRGRTTLVKCNVVSCFSGEIAQRCQVQCQNHSKRRFVMMRNYFKCQTMCQR